MWRVAARRVCAASPIKDYHSIFDWFLLENDRRGDLVYQAFYRKWRPRTFDDVVGQTHITETLKQQVALDRLSHAYLFTGTRGTGKTSCAKILARAVNCEAPLHGNPCNQCPACLGIENGSILDVLELDAASNNGVDQVRALRDEAVYTPAAVRKRVYIVDEVHMLSTPAFNALLKILEEPPAHLMFILATTELNKVPATIRSRCQQFAFKRILPAQIAQHLNRIASEECLTLSEDAANLLARLADGGLRDALSLLDQCSGTGNVLDQALVLDTLGLAGSVETAALMDYIAQRDTASALECLGRLYANGKDLASLFGELSALTRDLLLRKTAPQGAATLLTGGYDEATMRRLGEGLPAQRLHYILTQLQQASMVLSRSINRRTDCELCLIRLCDERLDDSLPSLAARLARLEQQPASGSIPAPPTSSPASAPVQTVHTKKEQSTGLPPWDIGEDPSPLPKELAGVAEARPPAKASRGGASPPDFSSDLQAAGDFWPAFLEGIKTHIPPSVRPYLSNSKKALGTWQPGMLTLWVDSAFTKSMLDKPVVTAPMIKTAEAQFGGPARIVFQIGIPEAASGQTSAADLAAPQAAAQTAPAPSMEEDALDELVAFGAQFDNIIIQ